MTFVRTAQVCHCGTKAATDNSHTKEHACVPIQLYLQKWQGVVACQPDLAKNRVSEKQVRWHFTL